jgi:hypothetical protein
MKIANPSEQQYVGAQVMSKLFSDAVYQQFIEVLTTSGLTAGKA